MRPLIVTNYWQPFNNPGTFRWWQFARYIDLDVLTVKKPKGVYDETLQERGHSVRRIRTFSRIACVNGVFLSFRALFIKADIYVFTIPSETLLIGAYILQRLGKKVIVDVRDKIDRNHQPVKLFIPLYNWLYKRMKNVVVAWKIVDDTKLCIEHGHDALKLKINTQAVMPEGRFKYKDYNEMLERGFVPDYHARKEVRNYVTSCYPNINHLWATPKAFSSWAVQATKMKYYVLRTYIRG